jgi:hypothetical protein
VFDHSRRILVIDDGDIPPFTRPDTRFSKSNQKTVSVHPHRLTVLFHNDCKPHSKSPRRQIKYRVIYL